MRFPLRFIFCFFPFLSLIAQPAGSYDVIKGDIAIEILPQQRKVKGQVTYEVHVLKAQDSFYIDARNMSISELWLNDADISYSYDGNRIGLSPELFKDIEKFTVKINYECRPERAMYFINSRDEEVKQVWTQGQGKNNSHWVPSFDDMNEKLIFDLNITVPDKYELITNGRLLEKQKLLNGRQKWVFDMNAPMSSYLLAIVMGEYNKEIRISGSGIPLELYYYPQDSAKVEPTYRYTKRIFDFLESEIGIPYPWQNYKQVPVHDFLYAGMENTGTTLFSDMYVIDSISFNDRNYVNINAHEMAHQWFGNLVTETSGTHHWLHEGFATYYALLAEKEIFGDDYFYWKLYDNAVALEQQDRSGESTALEDPAASSLTFYQKGAWALFMLRELVGDAVFRKSVSVFLEEYRFKNATTDGFFQIVEEISGTDLTDFRAVWMQDKDFQFERAIDALKQNSIFISEYLMVDCEVNSAKCSEYLESWISDEAKFKIILQNPGLVSQETFIQSNKVRQAIAIAMTEIPDNLKPHYESLLEDKSYITVENALYNLWVNFPAERSRYLNKTKSIQGFSDFNVRLLWLVLHLNTLEYQADQKKKMYDELLGYTSPAFNAQIRMQAFNYLNLIKACDDRCQQNLKNASRHHFWQLSKLAREYLEKLNKS